MHAFVAANEKQEHDWSGMVLTSTAPFVRRTTLLTFRLRTSVGSSQRTEPMPCLLTLKPDTAPRESGSSRAMAASWVRDGSML